jgi:hypothetical protein
MFGNWLNVTSSSDVQVPSTSLMTWRSTDSLREESHELCPDGLALKKRLISTGPAELDPVQNGSRARLEDVPVLQGQTERKPSPFTSTALHTGSPQLVRANGCKLMAADRRVICQCGACRHCLRPSSANAATHYGESMDSSCGDEAPLNLTVSSSRAAPSASQWRHENNSSAPRYSRQMVITAGTVCSRSVGCFARTKAGAFKLHARL